MFIWISFVILQLIRAVNPYFLNGVRLLASELNLDMLDIVFEFLTYQLWTVRYLLPVAMTGDGELGFDSGEGA